MGSESISDLRKEIASLEAKLSPKPQSSRRRLSSRRLSERDSIDRQIAELEETLMIDDPDELDDFVAPEEDLDIEAEFEDEECVDCEDDDLLNDELEDDFIDEEIVDEACYQASEDEVSKKMAEIENEITQESLEEVEGAAGSTVTTDGRPLDVAPTGYTARLREAEQRLDRVAAYLEKKGNKRLAYRIDVIADAVQAERENVESES